MVAVFGVHWLGCGALTAIYLVVGINYWYRQMFIPEIQPPGQHSGYIIIGQWTSGPAGLSGIQSFAIWFNNSSQSMNFGVDASQIYSIWIETSRTVAWLEWDTLWMRCDVL